ncbi:MAG: ATP-binding protein, partial [Deltaproteobacteria bacterium]|nr:ATP-binding protein [Deltaproteobacteria bacterium]
MGLRLSSRLSKNASIRDCLRKAPLLSSLITAIILTLAFNFLFWRHYLDHLDTFGESMSNFIEANIAPNLFLENYDEIKVKLENILSNPHFQISGLKIIDQKGIELFSKSPTETSVNFVKPLVFAGHKLGYLELHVSKKPFFRYIEISFLVSGCLLIFVGLMGWWMSEKLYKKISEPLASVLKFLEEIEKDKNYSRRLSVSTPEELNLIADGVNSMLKEIQTRDENLEKLVIDRTKELLDKQKELSSALIQLQKLSEAKNIFLANISHEIRTPLNAICFLTDELCEKARSDEKISYENLLSDLGVVRDSTKILLGLVNDLLDFSTILSNKFEFTNEIFDLLKTFLRTSSIFKDNAEAKGLTFIVETTRVEPMFVVGDEKRFSQVIMNLLSNAIKFTDQGFVKISLELSSVGSKAQVGISVEDTGIGIPEHQKNLIFEPFKQVDDSFSRRHAGVGLGL